METNPQIQETLEQTPSVKSSKSPKKIDDEEESKEENKQTLELSENKNESKILNIPPNFPKKMENLKTKRKSIKLKTLVLPLQKM